MSGKSIKDKETSESILISDYFLVTFDTSEEFPLIISKGSKLNILVTIAPKSSAYNCEFHQGNFSGTFEVIWKLSCFQTNIITSTEVFWLGPRAQDIIISFTSDTPAIKNQSNIFLFFIFLFLFLFFYFNFLFYYIYFLFFIFILILLKTIIFLVFSVKVNISNLTNISRELTLTLGDILEGNISRLANRFAGKEIERNTTKNREEGLVSLFSLQKEIRVGLLKPKGSTVVNLEFMPLKVNFFFFFFFSFFLFFFFSFFLFLFYFIFYFFFRKVFFISKV